MSTALSLYDNYAVSIDGKLDMECTNVKVQCDGKDVPIETILKGFAGIAPSPKTTMIDIEQATPQTGFDFDMFKSFIDSEIHNFSVTSLGSGRQISVDGFVQSPDAEGGVGKAAKVSFKALCQPGTFK